MLVDTYNQEGKKTGQSQLPKEIFGIEINPDLVHQVAVSQMANRRIAIAHTKNRSEVRGGGRKPWRQKGTGRARHGSRRSPIWKGGGVVFGPRKDRNFKKKINDKMRVKALFMVLSGKANDKELIVLDDLLIEIPKTKIMKQILNNLPMKSSSCLIALAKKDEKLLLSLRNISQTAVVPAKDLNALDLLSFKYLILPKESINIIKENFLKK